MATAGHPYTLLSGTSPVVQNPGAPPQLLWFSSQQAGTIPADGLSPNPSCPHTCLFACEVSGTLEHSLLQCRENLRGESAATGPDSQIPHAQGPPQWDKPKDPSPTTSAFLASQQGVFLQAGYPPTDPAPNSPCLPASSLEP